MKLARPERLLILAGLVTWLAVATPVARSLIAHPERMLAARGLLWMACQLGYGAAFWVGARLWAAGRAGAANGYRRWCPRLLAVQTVMAVILSAVGSGTTEGALLVPTAGALAFLVSWPVTVVWIVVATAAFGCVQGARGMDVLVPTVSFLGFQAFAVGAAHLAESEARAREQLARMHAALVAAQHLLTESGRLAERSRISRDLHDSLGHYLGAIAMNLEAARHMVDGQADELVSRARGAAVHLLDEVSQVVSAVRGDEGLDLRTALATLAAGVVRPRVELVVDDGLRLDDVAAAHTMFRCVQEVITNTVKHADAVRLRIEVAQHGRRLEVHAHDDGRGAVYVEAGHGLQGMRERFEQLGGELAVDSAPGRGFAIRGWVPLGRHA